MPSKSKNQPNLKLSETMIKNLAALIQRGVYIETAIAVLCISKETFYRWMKIGSKKKKGLHRALYDAVHKAVGEAETKHVVVIDKSSGGSEAQYVKNADGEVVLDTKGRPVVAREATPSDWKAAAWFLERRFRDRWGARQTIEHEGAIGRSAIAQTPEERAELDAELAALEKADKFTEGL